MNSNPTNEPDMTAQLFNAVARDDFVTVKEILSSLPSSYDLEKKDEHGSTLLHVAANRATGRIVKALLSKGCNILSRDKSEFTPLHMAAYHRNISTLKALLKHNAPVEVFSDSGCTPLGVAIKHGHSSAVKILLSYGANKINSNSPREPGITEQLFNAVAADDLDTVKLLLRSLPSSYDLETKKYLGSTLLNVAATCAKGEIVTVLLEKGCNILSRDNWRFTPLHTAAYRKNSSALIALLDNNAPMEVFSDWGETPLIVALKRGYLNIVKILLSYGAYVKERSEEGQTAINVITLNTSTSYKRSVATKLADTFYEYGASLEDTFNRLTPLQHAVKNRNYKMIRWLLEKGVNIDLVDKSGVSLEQEVIESNDLKLIELFKKYSDCCSNSLKCRH